jgi:pimeloyl-ACP methyl ester carboxylesterase
MSDSVAEDPGRFLSQISAIEQHDDLFQNLYVEHDDRVDSVSGLRRRRRRASNTPDGKILTASLIEQDGVLRWCDGVPAREVPRRRRRAGRAAEPPPLPDQNVVLTREFPRLEPNQAAAAIGAIDTRLNPAINVSLRSRLRLLQRGPNGFGFAADTNGPFTGRTLLFVHGTFSNAANMLAEFQATADGQALLNAGAAGAAKYDRILFFEHATLAVSPVLNALELGRALAGSSGQIDVIAHSRGGLIVRWWLEAFGSSLPHDAQVRVVFAGSPLYGTSLAAPDKLQHALSLISNIGTFADKTLQLVGVANPFLWVAGKLVEVVMTVTGTLANTPLIDGLVALIPGLFGQSRITNNYELNLLRLGPCATQPGYFVVQSNFETTNPGWQFWKNFRVMRIGDIAADAVFPGANDLVVDTASMTDLGAAGFPLNIRAVQDFGTSPEVWHCNYFRQKDTIGFIRRSFS